ncbi:MBL fold metallo-hydrolase [Deinococcus navajonensis]|uniref:MBL fold metallo-hydrolase n=1 Tax=Deinococcus navajonensis TaxID=309884 RepID=A0ABV8XQQ8_9DEIO
MLNAQVLGHPAQDNALWVKADHGQGQSRLLLDCGSGTLSALPFSELRAVDHVLFSHLHMDHVAGFDDLFRATFDRTDRENHIWGPEGTACILSHRFQGYWWNYASQLRATWLVHEVSADAVQSFRFEANEAFAVMHPAGSRLHQGVILETPQVRVQAISLQHHGPCLGFVLREPDRVAVDPAALAASGLRAGPWLSQLKAGVGGDLVIDGVTYHTEALNDALLRCEPGDSLAYLTDFLLDERQRLRLGRELRSVGHLYAEAQYAPEDGDLAQRHHHTTVDQVGRLASLAQVGELTLLHLSRRYGPDRWPELLDAARKHFGPARFPEGWLTGSEASRS